MLNISDTKSDYKFEGFRGKIIENVINGISKELNDKEKSFLIKLVYHFDNIFTKYIKPLFLGMVVFYLFNKIKAIYGVEQVFFIGVVVTILSFRSLNAKLGEIVKLLKK